MITPTRRHPSSRLGACCALALLIAGPIAPAEPAEDAMNPDRPDPHSYSTPRQVRVTHLDLVFNVDFDRKVIRGRAILTARRQPGAAGDAPLVVDAKGLRIAQIVEVADDPPRTPGAELKYTEGPADPILGRAVAIALPPGKDEALVAIAYETAPGAGALQWLDPAQTAGGKRPFLFTQSEAIQARTWIPCQDSPGVRTAYNAVVIAPPELRAVMAADAAPGDAPTPGVARFRMAQPVPAYLIALAVGDLEFRTLGPRTGVWAEPSVLDKAAHEFADTERMVEATEAKFGPYRWGRYDLLVLPPSFPFGGMENPKLTFATPTILAGDRSLVALVAHELAHSWSGNLVTNATWNDFWLNEGFTVYLERRIVESVYGLDRRRMEDVLGLGELRDDLRRLDARDQVLQLDLKGRDPDDGMNQVAYEKGALFLIELERVFGRDRFDPFLRGYFDAHAFRSITTADFVAYLRKNLLDPNPDLARQVDVAAWINQAGLNQPYVEPTSPRFEAVDRAAADWAAGKIAARELPTAGWTTQEWLRFLRRDADLAPTKMAELDAAFDLTRKQNAEIAGQWLLMAASNQYRAADPRIESFLTTVGRRKFIVPIYRALIQTEAGAERARAIFRQARPGYHPIAAESVAKLLGVP